MPILRGGAAGAKKIKKIPFSHFRLLTLQLSHCSHNFGGKKHHVL